MTLWLRWRPIQNAHLMAAKRCDEMPADAVGAAPGDGCNEICGRGVNFRGEMR